MQVSRNDKLIKRRARLGSYATFGGLGVLVVGMIASFRTEYLWVSMAALIAGFVLSQYGNYNLRRWGRSPRPDQLLETGLKGFDDRYHFYAWSLPAPFVLLTPQGVYNFITRDQTGPITYQNGRWRNKMSFGRALISFAQEGLGNPSQEATEAAEKLEEWIKKTLPDLHVPIQPAVIFISDKVELTAAEAPVPALESKGLKKWLRGTGKGESLKAADFKALEDLFNSMAA